MKRYNRRLAALVRQLGCPVHGSLLWCPVCDVTEPLPELLATMLDRLISAIVARVGTEALRAACLRVPPPVYRRCGRCGGHRQCGSCQERYAKAIFREIALTADEQAMLDALLADCRARERERG